MPAVSWRSGRLAGLFTKHRLAGKLDPVLVVDGDYLDLHDVTDLADAVHPIDVLVVQLADVAQAVAPRKNLDKGAEILDAGHASFVDFADADFLGQGFDLELGGFGAGRVKVRDKYRAVVIDIDLGAGGFLNALNGLTARSDEQAH